MPNYSLVSNAKFKPMSLERLLIPFQEYGKAYKEQEEALAELDTKASVWEGMANEQTDPIAYRQYKQYSDSLKAQRDAIATQGLSIGSRKAMLDLRSRYATDITPIEEAYKSRAERQKMQEQAYITSGGKVRFSQRADTQSLDAYLKGNKPEMTMVNLDDVYKESTAGAQAISKRYFSTEEGKLFGQQYYDLIQRQGYDAKTAADILENTGNYPEFAKFRDSMRTRSNYSQFSQVDRDAIDASIMQGFNTGIAYAEEHKPMENKEYMSKAERDASARGWASVNLQREQYRDQLAMSGITKGKDGSISYNPDKDYELQRKLAQTGSFTLSDGSTAYPVKGGYNVVDKDGKSTFKTPKDLAKEGLGTGIDNPLASSFKKIDYTGDSLGEPGWSDHFSESDAEQVDIGDLTTSQRNKMMQDLASYGLSLDDVDVYRDRDIFSRNHWRIVAKGADKSGTRTESTETEESKPGGYTGGFK